MGEGPGEGQGPRPYPTGLGNARAQDGPLGKAQGRQTTAHLPACPLTPHVSGGEQVGRGNHLVNNE